MQSGVFIILSAASRVRQGYRGGKLFRMYSLVTLSCEEGGYAYVRLSTQLLSRGKSELFDMGLMSADLFYSKEHVSPARPPSEITISGEMSW